MSDKNKGFLITIEGVDAVGKFTQTKKLKEYLEQKGKKVKTYSFPNYESLIGKIIAKYLKGEYGDINSVPKELICIAYSANRVHIQNELKQLLDDGYIIICDRYSHSNLFSAAKLPKDQWDDFINWTLEMEYKELNALIPDHTFYLYVDTYTTLKRIEERGKRAYQDEKEDIHENNPTLLTNTSECYLYYGEKQSEDKWTSINQMKNDKQLLPEEVSEIIINKVEQLMQI